MSLLRSITKFPRRAFRAALRPVDRALWKDTGDEDPAIEWLLRRTERPFLGSTPELDDAIFAARLQECDGWEHEEYAFRLRGDLAIDARTGFVTLPGFRYVRSSLPYAYQVSLPNAMDHAWQRRARSNARTFNTVVSLRDVNERNYFHFFNDLLCRLPLLQDQGLATLPMVVGPDLHTKRFFREALPMLQRAGFNFVEQDHRPVFAQEVLCCKAMPFNRPYYERVLRLLGSPEPKTNASDRIFLDRPPGRTKERSLINADQVRTIMKQRGFACVDTSTMPLSEQMTLLAGARCVVGVHGAGLTNMIFRQHAPLYVLELFPARPLPPHYAWLSRIWGHPYQALVGGEPTPGTVAFHVPPDLLEKALDRMDVLTGGRP